MKSSFGTGLATLAAVALFATGALAAGEITVVMPGEPYSLDPCNARDSDVGRILTQNVTESLTVLDHRNGSVVPKLATEWEQVDDLTWRFTLRDGVTFQDGAPFNAQAVADTLARLQTDELNCATRNQVFGLIEIEATPVDDLTVEFKTSQPVPIFPTLIATVQISSPNTPADQLTRTPVGTGPYAMTEWTAGDHILLQLRDDYWGEAPEVTQANYIWRSESALRASMVATGEADLSPVISVDDALDAAMDFAYPNGETTAIRIDMTIPPLDDVRVRKALNLAIDRESLLPLIGPEAQLSTQLIGPSVAGHNPHLTPYGYDPAEAHRLIDEARADGVPVDQRIEVIQRNNIYANSQLVMEAMFAMWSELGLNLEMKMVDVGNHMLYQANPFPDPEQPKLVQIQVDNLMGDASFTAFNRYHQDGVNSAVRDGEVSQLIEQAQLSTGDERVALFQDAFARLHDDIIADVYMYHMVGYTRVSPRLDWEPSAATNNEVNLSEIGFRD